MTGFMIVVSGINFCNVI